MKIVKKNSASTNSSTSVSPINLLNKKPPVATPLLNNKLNISDGENKIQTDSEDDFENDFLVSSSKKNDQKSLQVNRYVLKILLVTFFLCKFKKFSSLPTKLIISENGF